MSIKNNNILLAIIILCSLLAVVLIGTMGYMIGLTNGADRTKHLTDSSIVYLHDKILDLPEEISVNGSEWESVVTDSTIQLISK